jgi:hypothetical protein
MMKMMCGEQFHFSFCGDKSSYSFLKTNKVEKRIEKRVAGLPLLRRGELACGSVLGAG